MLKYTAAFLQKTCIKIVTDFTGLTLATSPYELGGIYYSFNTIVLHASAWVIVCMYTTAEQHVVDTFIDDSRSIYAFLGALQIAWLTFAVFLFLSMKPKGRYFFFSTLLGKDNTKSFFLDAVEGEDWRRSHIFDHSIDLWKDIEKDVQVWTLANWQTWEKEKPFWFSVQFRAKVPPRFLPVEGRNGGEGFGGEERGGEENAQ